jgi:protein-tyrosine phosphatase
MDGRRIRQGLVYRSAGINDNPEDIDFLTWAQCRAEFAAGVLTNRAPWQAKHMAKIYSGLWPSNDWHRVPIANARGRERLNDESRRIMLEDLGIRTDLDIRAAGETAGMGQSPLGDRVKWIHSPCSAYSGFGRPLGKKMVKACIDVFLDEANYPIVFHCIAGADRTGSLACVLNGLLGVDAGLLYKDWQYTWTAKGREVPEERWENLMKVFSKYEGATLNEKIENFVLSNGFTAADIEKFRSLML